jgi:glyoxylase-like metal-dependent hydrolase (beta-lactamase superfamily II)
VSDLAALVFEGRGAHDALPLGDGIFMSKGIANSYLVTTDEGDLLVNTGLHTEAPEIKARFARVSSDPLRTIVFTQGHPDHVGGWSQFDAPGVETIAQANHADVREYWRRLHPFYAARIATLWGGLSNVDRSYRPPEPVLTTTFVDQHAFTLGGRRVELYAVPGGEALDGLVVWLPDDRTVFIGNLMGPMFGHVPNLYTIRGDKLRSAMSFLRCLDRVMALEPEVLVNGHDSFRGADEIRSTMQRVRDVTTYLRDRTIDGMNAGEDLWTLMETIRPPADLALPQMHGKVPWIVRSIWEEHAGWFRYGSTTELYHVPPSAVWGDVVELSGGSGGLTARARAHADAGRPLHSLHLTDMVLAQAPGDLDALAVKRSALEQLMAASGGENFSEVQWLQQEIGEVDAALQLAGQRETP